MSPLLSVTQLSNLSAFSIFHRLYHIFSPQLYVCLSRYEISSFIFPVDWSFCLSSRVKDTIFRPLLYLSFMLIVTNLRFRSFCREYSGMFGPILSGPNQSLCFASLEMRTVHSQKNWPVEHSVAFFQLSFAPD